MTTTDFTQIPRGLFLFRGHDQSRIRQARALLLKVDDGPWYEQPRVPVYTMEATHETHAQFWQWAEENLPVYEHGMEIKRSD